MSQRCRPSGTSDIAGAAAGTHGLFYHGPPFVIFHILDRDRPKFARLFTLTASTAQQRIDL
ncbi:hypothetical protein LDC_1684, partial [sediment metagenome]